MSRGAKLALLVVVVIAALLAINTVIVDGETKDAEPTADGGRILKLPGGEVQVLEEGPSASDTRAPRPPIVLVHCYSCSLHWYDRLAPILARTHRVIRVDLLGHGGSEKPSSGYGIDEQAALVAGALDRLGVEGAVVVGHSMGFSVAVALAEQASQLVDRVVNLGEGPDLEACELPFTAKLAYAPVLGEASWRLTPDSLIEDGYESAFAPGFDVSSGFPDSGRIVEDFRAMTYTAFSEAHDANDDFREEAPLDERIARTAVPLLSVFGAEDQVCDAGNSQATYETVPGARTATIRDAGHSPNVEKPAETAQLIAKFAAEAGDVGGRENRAGRGKQVGGRSERR